MPMSDLLFDVPWWIPTLVAFLGIFVFWNGNNRQQTRLRNAGSALVLLAVAWLALNYFVDTDKEKCEKGTVKLVDDVTKGQWSQFQAKLAPDVVFRVQGGNSYADGSEPVTTYAKAGATAISLESAYVQSSHAEQTGTIITVTANIFSTQSAASSPPTMNSSFQFDWELLNEGWKVREIRIMQIGNTKARDIESFMHIVR
jgi:hypothetical protein